MFDKNKIHTSFIGTAVFPKLVKPETKWNKDGVYEVKIKGTKAEEDAFIAYLQPLLDEAHLEVCKEQKKKTIKKANAWHPEIEKKKDEQGMVVEEIPTGFQLFKFKLNAQGKRKDGTIYYMKPGLFDSQGKAVKVHEGLEINGGSMVRVAFRCRPYYTAKDNIAGLTLQIVNVQLVKLVERGGVTAEASGFTAVDGGYVDDGGSVSEAQGSPSAPSDEAPDPTDADF